MAFAVSAGQELTLRLHTKTERKLALESTETELCCCYACFKARVWREDYLQGRTSAERRKIPVFHFEYTCVSEFHALTRCTQFDKGFIKMQRKFSARMQYHSHNLRVAYTDRPLLYLRVRLKVSRGHNVLSLLPPASYKFQLVIIVLWIPSSCAQKLTAFIFLFISFFFCQC